MTGSSAEFEGDDMPLDSANPLHVHCGRGRHGAADLHFDRSESQPRTQAAAGPHEGREPVA